MLVVGESNRIELSKVDKQVRTYSPSPSWPSEKLTIKNAIAGESIRIDSVGLDNVDDVIFLVYFLLLKWKNSTILQCVLGNERKSVLSSDETKHLYCRPDD